MMENPKGFHHDDLLERAVEAVLRDPIPGDLSQEQVAQLVAVVRQAADRPYAVTLMQRIRNMKRLAKIAVAATVVAAIGFLLCWFAIGGSGNIAFAKVADALDSLRSATFDMTSEGKGEKGQPSAKATGKGYFLAPSHERIETSVEIGNDPAVKAAAEAARRMSLKSHPGDSKAAKAAAEAAAKSTARAVALMPKTKMTQLMIVDGQTGKSIMLTPNMKLAMTMDLKKMRENMKKSGKVVPPDLFEMVRRLAREGSSGTGEQPERLGNKEIDGRDAVGFRVHVGGMDLTIWAYPKTAYPIRIEGGAEMLGDVHIVMNNFRYDVALDPSLFSLEPPAGYSTIATDVTMPVETDLLSTLRMIAEHNKDVFPAKLGMNQEVMKALMAGLDMMPDKSTQEKLEAEMKKIEAKYGGKEKLRAKYGAQLPPEIMAEFMKATTAITQEGMQERMLKQMPIMQKRQRGLTFYQTLTAENDPHYAGGDVKLGTPDRPILWYKPTGAQKYRVIYADLSVKELAPDDVKKLSDAKPK
jgi:outer membrane lipoprotein-sorting protein